MNLTELQQYVWAQTDTTNIDLSGATIANYLDEAFIHTMAAENRWPFYEQGWQLAQQPGTTWLDMPIDMGHASIVSIMPVTHRGRHLTQINQEEAESRFTTVPAGAGYPGYFSLWANKIWLWPLGTSNQQVEFIVRGYRTPLTTFNAQTGQVDADPRLHRALAHYAIALAYAQQEDDVLEGRYMERWANTVEIVRKALMDPSGNRPIVMYGDFRSRRGVPGSSVGGGGGGTGVYVVS